MSKTIVTEIKKIDHKTGEIKEEEITTKWKSDEPNYIKLYLNDISYLYDLPKSSGSLLYELFNYITYKNNQIILNSSIKKLMANNLNITIQSLQNNLTKLVNKKILKRMDKGVFILNPYLFGKGDWKSIKELRNQNIEMKIIYNATTNRREIKTKVNNQPTLL